MKVTFSKYCLLSGMVILNLSSCIRDEIEPCPPLSVRVEVTDKNYFNVRAVDLEKPVDENLPLREYVSGLRYSLKCLSTGVIIEQNEVKKIEDDRNVYDIVFDDQLPHGKYEFTVFATGKDGGTLSFDDSGQNLKLHPSKSEGADIFLTTDTLVYDAWNYDYTAGLERVKGKLLILLENIPSDCMSSALSVNGLYDIVTPSFLYKGISSVDKAFPLSGQDSNSFLSGTVLSPSSGNGASTLSLVLKDVAGDVLPESGNLTVKVEMRRNELTLLRYTYGTGGNPVINLFVNDHWEEIHGMEID